MSEAAVAAYAIDQLQGGTHAFESATIVDHINSSSSSRNTPNVRKYRSLWPLLLDPQLVGMAWIRAKEGSPDRRLTVLNHDQVRLFTIMHAMHEQGLYDCGTATHTLYRVNDALLHRSILARSPV